VSDSSPNITVRKTGPASAKVDALIVGVHTSGDGLTLVTGADEVDAAFGGSLVQTLGALGAKGKPDEVTLVPSGGAVSASLVAAVGLGAEPSTPETLRRAAGAAVRHLAGKAVTAAFALTCGDAPAVSALAEGALLGAYFYDEYRSNHQPTKRLTAITIVSDQARDKAVKAALTRAQVVARAVNLTRSWVNASPSDLYPSVFADQAKAEAKRAKVQVEVLDKKALANAGYGGIIGVGQGSQRPPRLVRLSYRPSGAKRHLALIGKGITFDAGGLSLKPNDGMVTMKCDMAGAGAVLAATCAIAELGLPIAVTTYAAMAENMPSGTAQRPSDVLTMYGGKTVEVLNTDAEGRLVMADAIVRAGEDNPDLIVDVATLTGACMVALGSRVFGIMSDDDELSRQLADVAKAAGEEAWPLPIPEGTRERLDSKVADLANVATQRLGGALVAASFLHEFVGDGTPWAHLDIAGPSFNEGGPWGYTPSGGTGSAVRTLIFLAEAVADGELVPAGSSTS
jgi:leucyl aminopeptidase